MSHVPLSRKHPAFEVLHDDLKNTMSVSSAAWTSAAEIYHDLRQKTDTPRPLALRCIVEHAESLMPGRKPGTIRSFSQQRDILIALVCLMHQPAEDKD